MDNINTYMNLKANGTYTRALSVYKMVKSNYPHCNSRKVFTKTLQTVCLFEPEFKLENQ